MQAKFYLAGIFRQGYETPVTIKVLKGAVQEFHGDQFGGLSDIFSSEAVLDVVIIDHYRSVRNRFILMNNG